jgi:mono/diheme cytochrome c family protein
MRSRRCDPWRLRLLLGGAIAAGALAPVMAADPTATAETIAAPINEKYHVDIKKLFAANCSWCHDGYGIEAGKGPKLAGTAKTIDQVAGQIANGKAGYMPGYKKVLKEEQIQALAEYIKALPAN